MDVSDIARDKKSARRAEVRRTRKIFNRVGGDGDNFFPTVRDKIYNLHIARDDSRCNFNGAVFRRALENFNGRGRRDADNLSADFIFYGVAADGG